MAQSIQINLLPWREQARAIKKIQLGLSLGLAFLLALILSLCMHFYYYHFFSLQQAKNTLIQNEVNKEKGEVTLVESKEHSYSSIVTQLRFIIKLRNENFRAVRMLNEFLTIVPSTISITKIARTNPFVVIVGKADSNSEITHFMKNIDASPVFKNPVLTGISVEKISNKDEGYFKLRVEQKD